MIYFIQRMDPGSLIKIGYAKEEPFIRMLVIQKKLGIPLTMLGVIPGHLDHERKLHERFSRYRVEGEWFTPNPEIWRFIDKYALRIAMHEVRRIREIARTVVD